MKKFYLFSRLIAIFSFSLLIAIFSLFGCTVSSDAYTRTEAKMRWADQMNTNIVSQAMNNNYNCGAGREVVSDKTVVTKKVQTDFEYQAGRRRGPDVEYEARNQVTGKSTVVCTATGK